VSSSPAGPRERHSEILIGASACLLGEQVRYDVGELRERDVSGFVLKSARRAAASNASARGIVLVRLAV
jgi:hypothetical protein